jgi:hypothetical protein
MANNPINTPAAADTGVTSSRLLNPASRARPRRRRHCAQTASTEDQQSTETHL